MCSLWAGLMPALARLLAGWHVTRCSSPDVRLTGAGGFTRASTSRAPAAA